MAAQEQDKPMADTQTLEAPANTDGAASDNGAEAPAETSGIKKQVSFMCPVELMVRLEEAALASGVKTDAKGHTNISGVLLAAAANSLTPPYVLTAKEKTGSGIELSEEDKAAKRAEAAAARKKANDEANAAAQALRDRMRAKAQEQLAAS